MALRSINKFGKVEREGRVKRWCTYSGATDPLTALANSMEGACSDPWETIWLAGSTVEEEMLRWHCLATRPDSAENGINAARRVLDKHAKKLGFDIHWEPLSWPEWAKAHHAARDFASKEQAA